MRDAGGEVGYTNAVNGVARGVLCDVGRMGGDERRGPLVPGGDQRGVRSADLLWAESDDP